MSGRSWRARRENLRKSLPGRAALWAASAAYGGATAIRRGLYGLGILKGKRLGAKVICFGNLTTGGTGKTPAVLLAAQTLRKRNRQVAILTRGYGAKRKKAPKDDGRVLALLEDVEVPWTECGDEPWMMRHCLRGLGVPILVCPDRWKAGRQALTYYRSEVILLDDGFQHLQLHRDLDIVLLNAPDPFGGERLLPAGDLREPIRELGRAHLVLVTHADEVPPGDLEALRGRIRGLAPGAAVVESAHRPDFLLNLRTRAKLSPKTLEGREAASFCGLGRPEQFEGMLKRLGASLAHRWRFPDHHPYTLVELRSIQNARLGTAGADPNKLPALLTTFKDAPRLPDGWENILTGDVLALGIKLEILKGKKEWNDALSAGL